MAGDRATALVVAAILSLAVVSAASQSPSLKIVNAGPLGDIDRLDDAGEIRIVFSEPMVALGAVPPGAAPSWIHITPAVAGSYYWSGTKTLIVSPDVSAPLPFATAFTVRVDATATSVAGRTLGAPYEFAFTTPTPQLLSAEWYRANERFDRPAVIALNFNQPMRPADVVAHTRVTLEPHAWQAPALSPDARTRWRHADPAGLRRYDDKVAAVRRVTSQNAAVGIRAAVSWNEERFPADPTRVIVETTTAPPPDGWLRIAMDAALPSPGGPITHGAQSALVKLDATFFVNRVTCETDCAAGVSEIAFTRQAEAPGLARALTIADVTDPAHERPVVAVRGVPEHMATGQSWTLDPGDAGFDPQPPAKTWRLRLSADLRAGDGQTLGYPWMGFVETAHSPGFVALGGSVWEASGGPRVPLNARNAQSVSERFEAVEPSSIVARLREEEQRTPFSTPDGASTRVLRVTPDVVQTHGMDVGRLLSPRGTGLIWSAVAIAGSLPRYTARGGTTTLNEVVSPSWPSSQRRLLQVTNLGITVKDSPQSTLVFVTRLDTGAPVVDARVAIVDAANKTRWSGATDRDGVALAPALDLRRSAEPGRVAFAVTAEKDGDTAFVASNWSAVEAFYSWSIRYDLDEAEPILRGSVFTDRGVYTPREDVHVKAMLREDTPSGMRRLGTDAVLEVVVQDDQGHEVDRRRVSVNRWSSAEWTWRVPDDAGLGKYRIDIARVSVAGDDSATVSGMFRVAAFRRPDFRVDTTLTGEPAILGSTLHGVVQASYLFGAPLGSRPVGWWYSRIPVQSAPDAILDRYPDARYAVGYLPESANEVEQKSVVQKTESLSADGRVEIAIPTSATGDAAYRYALEASVGSASSQHIANSASLVVHPASLYVAIARPPLFVDSGKTTSVGFVAVDLSGKAVADVAVSVSLLRERWVSTGADRWGGIVWVRNEIPAGNWALRTGAGETTLPMTVVESGSYVLRAVARDAAGRQTRTEATFYALGSGSAFWRSEGNQFDLIPERKTWKPGESARILIPSPWPNATALLTVEREGIRSHRRFTITSTQDTVEVPITEADVPNVYVSVLLVKGRTSGAPTDSSDPGAPAYRVGYTELTVDSASKRLAVSVAADRKEYRPSDPVRVSVTVATADGRPAASEVTLWAVDYGLLSLTGYKTPDVLEAIYVPKSLQVRTADTRERLMRRVPMDVRFGIPGAQDSDLVNTSMANSLAFIAEERGDVVDGVRQDFRPLVFWLGSAVTGDDGRATTTVTLPESLTTYRVMAVAGDEASRFGFGEHEIRVTKPLTLLPAFPRFLSKGDRPSFGAVVTNAGTSEGTAEVTIQSLDPATLQFNEARRSIRLAPGASQSVTFDAVATGAGDARVRIAATLGGETDALQMPLTVRVPLRPETTAAYGDTLATATERLAVPSGALPDIGGLTVELASTALVGLGDSARYLDEYPYDCAEQKASRLLALLLASDAGGAFKLSGVNPADYRSTVTSILGQLSAHQCSNGGFALWAGRCGGESAYLTAYVLHVMKVAQAAGVSLDSGAIDAALGFLEGQLQQPTPDDRWWTVWAVSQAYSIKVLAEFERKPRASIDWLATVADRLPILALSFLADALAASGDKGPRYQDVVRRLTNAIRLDADRAHVEEHDEDALGWLWNTNARATAVVLDGMVRRKDDATFVAPLVRWLLAARTNGRWATTHENAMALESLVAYYRAFERETPNMTAAVSVGSATVGTATFDGRSTASQRIHVSMPDLLKNATAPAPFALSITRAGTGRLFYTARMESVAPQSSDAVDRGFAVERRYQLYVRDGASPSATTFKAGDLIRVTVALTIRGEGRYLALTDPLPAGFEPLEDWSLTASDLVRAMKQMENGGDDWLAWWRGGYFEHVEKHDDRVIAFATRLASGRHEFSYLVRATTAGTFDARGASVEAMYAPELSGRSAASMVTVR